MDIGQMLHYSLDVITSRCLSMFFDLVTFFKKPAILFSTKAFRIFARKTPWQRYFCKEKYPNKDLVSNECGLVGTWAHYSKVYARFQTAAVFVFVFALVFVFVFVFALHIIHLVGTLADYSKVYARFQTSCGIPSKTNFEMGETRSFIISFAADQNLIKHLL